MTVPALSLENRTARLLLRYSGIYLIYLAVVARAYVDVRGSSDALWIAVLLVVYGILLVSSERLISRLRSYMPVYLALQAGLAICLLVLRPALDYLPLLFAPLSLQAVLFYGRKVGFAIIFAFILAFGSISLSGAPEKREILLMIPANGGFFFVIGNLAHLIKKAEDTHQESQRLLAELQIANRHLQESAVQAEELAAMQERSRMARELHDSVTQTIFSMNLAVQSASMLVGKDLESAGGQIERLQELARSAAVEIQALATQLRPRSVTEEGLPNALRRLVTERERRDRLELRLEIDGERDLSPAVITGLYRIVQEALNNVAKHAQIREATVRLSLGGERACLDIEDHGAGFDIQKQIGHGHLGMAGMAERAKELGWNLHIDSQPGKGTRVHLEEAGP